MNVLLFFLYNTHLCFGSVAFLSLLFFWYEGEKKKNIKQEKFVGISLEGRMSHLKNSRSEKEKKTFTFSCACYCVSLRIFVALGLSLRFCCTFVALLLHFHFTFVAHVTYARVEVGSLLSTDNKLRAQLLHDKVNNAKIYRKLLPLCKFPLFHIHYHFFSFL